MSENFTPQQFEAEETKKREIDGNQFSKELLRKDEAYYRSLVEALKRSGLPDEIMSQSLENLEVFPQFQELMIRKRDRKILFPDEFEIPELHDYKVEKEMERVYDVFEIETTESGFRILSNFGTEFKDYDFDGNVIDEKQFKNIKNLWQVTQLENNDFLACTLHGLYLYSPDLTEKLQYQINDNNDHKLSSFQVLPNNRILAMFGNFIPGIRNKDKISILTLNDDGSTTEEVIFDDLLPREEGKTEPLDVQMSLEGDVYYRSRNDIIYRLRMKTKSEEWSLKNICRTSHNSQSKLLSDGSIIWIGSDNRIHLHQDDQEIILEGDFKAYHAVGDKIIALGPRMHISSDTCRIFIFNKDKNGSWNKNPEIISLEKYNSAGFDRITFLRDGRILVARILDGSLGNMPKAIILNGTSNV